jgi:hypothetical protein
LIDKLRQRGGIQAANVTSAINAKNLCRLGPA